MAFQARVAVWGVLAAFALSALAAAPAIAGRVDYVYSFSLGGEGEVLTDPRGAAVDGSSEASAGDVYVADAEAHRVVRFDARGHFVLMFGAGVDGTTNGDVCTAASGHICRAGRRATTYEPGEPPAGAFDYPEQIAVDPRSGDVYVGDVGIDLVSKFTSSGQLVSAWGAGGAIQFDHLFGVATGPTGELLVLSLGPDGETPRRGALERFDPDGTPVETTLLPDPFYDHGLALDPAGDIFTVRSGALTEFDQSGNEVAHFESPGTSTGLAIDPVAGELLVAKRAGPVDALDLDCAQPRCAAYGSFGEGILRDTYLGWRGIGVEPADHAVYVTDPTYAGRDEVDVFLPRDQLPEAITGQVLEIEERSALATGVADAAGAAQVTGCRFEYVDETAFLTTGYHGAPSAPCELPYPGYATARLTGLQPGLVYHTRIVVENAVGPRTGSDRTFRTANYPHLTIGAASEIGDSWATISGRATPAEGPSPPAVRSCHFAYVGQREFDEGGFAAATEVPCDPPPPYPRETLIGADLSDLSAATTYHYRIAAETDVGAQVSAEGAFTTEPLPERHRWKRRKGHRKRVRCAAKACVRILRATDRPRTWVSYRFPKAYGWLFSIHKGGKSLRHTRPAGGCASTFKGRGMIATLNGCRGRFKLTYIGRGKFRVHWRVFEHCRCAELSAPRGRAGPGTRPR
jgi:hypothetical protein